MGFPILLLHAIFVYNQFVSRVFLLYNQHVILVLNTVHKVF